MWTRTEKLLLIAASLIILIVGFLLKPAYDARDASQAPLIENTAHEGIPLSGPAP